MIQYFRNCLEGKRAGGRACPFRVYPVAASTNKKSVIRRFDREAVAGFVNPQTYLHASGIEVLTLAGAAMVLPYDEVKMVCFVREFETGEPSGETRLFQTRPKMSGLWVRMRFRDNEVMDGLMANNLLQVEACGYTFVPPNPNANNQRIFVPKAALVELQVIGVVGSPLRTSKPKPKPREQIELFE